MLGFQSHVKCSILHDPLGFHLSRTKFLILHDLFGLQVSSYAKFLVFYDPFELYFLSCAKCPVLYNPLELHFSFHIKCLIIYDLLGFLVQPSRLIELTIFLSNNFLFYLSSYSKIKLSLVTLDL